MPKTAKIKTAKVNLRLTPAERQAIERLANQEGCTLTEIMRRILRESLTREGLYVIGLNSLLSEHVNELRTN